MHDKPQTYAHSALNVHCSRKCRPNPSPRLAWARVWLPFSSTRLSCLLHPNLGLRSVDSRLKPRKLRLDVACCRFSLYRGLTAAYRFSENWAKRFKVDSVARPLTVSSAHAVAPTHCTVSGSRVTLCQHELDRGAVPHTSTEVQYTGRLSYPAGRGGVGSPDAKVELQP